MYFFSLLNAVSVTRIKQRVCSTAIYALRKINHNAPKERKRPYKNTPLYFIPMYDCISTVILGFGQLTP
jgi:hypothetical protein